MIGGTQPLDGHIGYNGISNTATRPEAHLRELTSRNNVDIKFDEFQSGQVTIAIGQILYTYLLSMRTIEVYCPPRQQLFSKAKPREIVAVRGTINLLLSYLSLEYNILYQRKLNFSKMPI